LLQDKKQVIGRSLGAVVPCKKIPVIPVNKAVDEKRTNGKRGAEEEEG
jgi:hypothetical protein